MGHRHNGEAKAVRMAQLIKASSVSIEQAIRVASEAQPGTVVEAKLKRKLKKVAWKVRVQTAHGQVRIYIDGSSGAILATKVDPLHEPFLPVIQTAVGTEA